MGADVPHGHGLSSACRSYFTCVLSDPGSVPANYQPRQEHAAAAGDSAGTCYMVAQLKRGSQEW